MKKLVFCVLLIPFFSFSSFTQPSPTLQIDWEKKEVLVNRTIISKHSTADVIRKALGRETRVMQEDGNPTRLYIYDSLGINFVIDTVAGILRKIDIYCSKGRGGDFETSPRNLFAGQFSVNKQIVTINENVESIKLKTKLPFKQMGGLPWFTADHREFSLTIAYTNKDQENIGALHILLHSEED